MEYLFMGMNTIFLVRSTVLTGAPIFFSSFRCNFLLFIWFSFIALLTKHHCFLYCAHISHPQFTISLTKIIWFVFLTFTVPSWSLWSWHNILHWYWLLLLASLLLALDYPGYSIMKIKQILQYCIDAWLVLNRVGRQKNVYRNLMTLDLYGVLKNGKSKNKGSLFRIVKKARRAEGCILVALYWHFLLQK